MERYEHAELLLDLTEKFTEGQKRFFWLSFCHISTKDFSGLKKTAIEYNDQFNEFLEEYQLKKQEIKKSELNDILEIRTMKTCKAILRGTEELMSIDDQDYLSVYDKLMILKDEYSSLQSK